MSVYVNVLSAEAIARLQGLESKGENLTGVMRSFGAHMEGSIQKNFDAEGRPDKWLPLKNPVSWINRYKKGGQYRAKGGGLTKAGERAVAGRKVLTLTARLRNSVHTRVYADRLVVEAGSNVEYAAIHQFGGWAGRGHKARIPARPYLMVQTEDIERFGQMLNKFLMEGK